MVANGVNGAHTNGTSALNGTTKTGNEAVDDREEANKAAYEHDYPPSHDVIERTEYDIVVIGAGPAGLMLCSSLARFGGHKILIIDSRHEPTSAGRADGIQPRTLEVLKNMSPLGEELFKRSSASYERTFWDPTEDGNGIYRARRAQSFPAALEIEDGATLGLQQGMIEEAFLRDMDRHDLRVHRPYLFHSFTLPATADKSTESYPVTVQLKKGPTEEGGTDGGEITEVKCKYLIGCDGGRSAVRELMMKDHGVVMTGEYVDTLWGALDAVVTSDFPDLRKIAAIHSAKNGAMYIFPRENNIDNRPMVRLYTQVNIIGGEKSKLPAQEMRWKVTAEDIMNADKRIIAPYKLEFEKVEWWSAYPIGQRLVSKYDLDGRVFIAGDACHTHSPKAGQGMNTALMDSHNLSFKLNLVLRGLAGPELLKTYHEERWKIGKQLIDFDEEYAALFSGEVPRNSPQVAQMTKDEVKKHFVDVQRKNAAFTTGAGVNYAKSALAVMNEDLGQLGLEPLSKVKLRAGERLVPVTVTRSVNTQPVRLIHEIQYTSPGGFRIYVLAGKLKESYDRLKAFSTYLTSPKSFMSRYTARIPKNRPVLHEALNTGLIGYESLNPFFAVLTVLNESRFAFNLEDLKDLKGLNSMIYADDEDLGGDRIGDEPSELHVGGAHKKYGLEEGGIVVCRPDGYVAVVLPLTEAGWQSLDPFFDAALYK